MSLNGLMLGFRFVFCQDSEERLGCPLSGSFGRVQGFLQAVLYGFAMGSEFLQRFLHGFF